MFDYWNRLRHRLHNRFYCGYVKDKEEVNKIFNDALRREQEARELCDKAERNLEDAQNCLNEARKQNEEMKKELYGNERISGM